MITIDSQTGRRPSTRLVTAALAIALALTIGVTSVQPASAATPVTQSQTAVTSTVAAPATLPAAPVAKHVAPAVKWYGCAGLVNGARSLHVAAFVLGYCPSVWVLQATPWGRSIVNWIVNGACKVPWIVRAATGGRFSTC